MMAGERPVIWGDGNQTRDFIFVEDAARGFVNAMGIALESETPMAETVNLGFGVEHSFLDVMNIAAEELDIKPDPVFVDVPIKIYAHRLWATTDKMRSFLALTPRVTLRQGIRQIIECTRELWNRDPRWRKELARRSFITRNCPEPINCLSARLYRRAFFFVFIYLCEFACSPLFFRRLSGAGHAMF